MLIRVWTIVPIIFCCIAISLVLSIFIQVRFGLRLFLTLYSVQEPVESVIALVCIGSGIPVHLTAGYVSKLWSRHFI